MKIKLTIGKKLIGGFLIVAIIFGISSGLSFYFIHKIQKSFSDFAERRANVLVATKEMETHFALLDKAINDSSTRQTGGDNLSEINYNMDLLIEVNNKLAETDSRNKSTNEQQLAKIDQLYQKYKNNVVAYLDFEDQADRVQYVDQSMIPVAREIITEADIFQQEQRKLSDQESQNLLRMVQSAIFVIVIVSIIALLAAIAIGIFFSRMISKPIIGITNVAERIAAGDLRVIEIKVKNTDEIGALANSFQLMSKNLREFISHVRENAEQVAASSEQLTASSEQTSLATEQVANDIQEVASGTDEQVQSVIETNAEIVQVSKSLQQISTNAQGVHSTATFLNKKASEGNETLQTAVQQMSSIQHTVSQLAEQVKELGNRSHEIEQFIGMIANIAAQTNLLSLNAAIEAARAGELGKGFAVVANEVRKLAEQSAKSASKSRELVAALQEETNHTARSMETAMKEVGTGIVLVKEAGKSFADIRMAIHDVTVQIGDVSDTVQHISSSTEQMAHSIKTVAKVAEYTSSNAQKVSAATEEQLGSIQEISSLAALLSSMAGELQKSIHNFKI